MRTTSKTKWGTYSWVNDYKKTNGVSPTAISYNHEKKSDIVKGDFHSPLPYSAERCNRSGHMTTERFAHKWVGWPNSLWTKVSLYKASYPMLTMAIHDPWVGNMKASGGVSTHHGSYVTANNQMLERLYQKQVDFGTMVAELTETVPYLVDKVKSVALGLKAIKRGRWNRALTQFGINKRDWNSKRKVLKSSASRYIEYRFAIAPTLNDINTVMDLHRGVYKKQHAFTFSVKGKSKEQRDASDGSSYDDGTTTTSLSYGGTRTMNVKIQGKITDMDAVRDKAFGLDSIVGPIWQLLPFSWVVDYVINIGDYIGLLQATKGTAFINGYYSTKTVCSANMTRTYDLNDKELTIEKSEHNCVGYVRNVLTQYPTASLEIVLPNISAGKVSNLLAVLAILRL